MLSSANRIGLCHKKPTDQNDFYTERKAKMSLEANSVHVSPRCGLSNSAYFKDFIEESAWKFRRFFFCPKFLAMEML